MSSRPECPDCGERSCYGKPDGSGCGEQRDRAQPFNAADLYKAVRAQRQEDQTAQLEKRHREFVKYSIEYTIEAVEASAKLGVGGTTICFAGGGNSGDLPWDTTPEYQWVPEVLAKLDELAPSYGWRRYESTEHFTSGYHDPRPHPALRWD